MCDGGGCDGCGCDDGGGCGGVCGCDGEELMSIGPVNSDKQPRNIIDSFTLRGGQSLSQSS